MKSLYLILRKKKMGVLIYHYSFIRLTSTLLLYIVQIISLSALEVQRFMLDMYSLQFSWTIT
jgi:hypothetical protein